MYVVCVCDDMFIATDIPKLTDFLRLGSLSVQVVQYPLKNLPPLPEPNSDPPSPPPPLAFSSTRSSSLYSNTTSLSSTMRSTTFSDPSLLLTKNSVTNPQPQILENQNDTPLTPLKSDIFNILSKLSVIQNLEENMAQARLTRDLAEKQKQKHKHNNLYMSLSHHHHVNDSEASSHNPNSPNSPNSPNKPWTDIQSASSDLAHLDPNTFNNNSSNRQGLSNLLQNKANRSGPRTESKGPGVDHVNSGGEMSTAKTVGEGRSLTQTSEGSGVGKLKKPKINVCTCVIITLII